jgi:hypothetical protein
MEEKCKLYHGVNKLQWYEMNTKFVCQKISKDLGFPVFTHVNREVSHGIAYIMMMPQPYVRVK